MSPPILLTIFTAFCGGSIPPFAKVALQAFQPFTLACIRFSSAAFILLPFIYRSKELSLKHAKELFTVAVVGALNPILIFIALQYTKASVSPFIYAVCPLVSLLYLRYTKHQQINTRQIVGVVLGLIGVIFIVVLPILADRSVGFEELKGNLIIVAAAIAFLAYGFMSKSKQEKLGITPLALTFYFAAITFILAIPFAVYENLYPANNLVPVAPIHIFAALEIGIIGTSVFYLAYQYALKHETELTANLFTYLQPVSTVFFSVLLLGETITLPFIIGGTLAIIGAQITTSGKKI